MGPAYCSIPGHHYFLLSCYPRGLDFVGGIFSTGGWLLSSLLRSVGFLSKVDQGTGLSLLVIKSPIENASIFIKSRLA